jgi:hypothetical protein
VRVPRWALQQREFAGALLDSGAAIPDCLATRVGQDTQSRLDVYRNNVHSSLIDALVATFPVAVKLVSEESFRVLARQYLRHELPGSAALHEYGMGLAAFIRGWAPAADLPCLADVAALEYAWWQAYGAAEAPVLSLREVATLAGDQLLDQRMLTHPAMQLVRSAYPVHGIWSAHQSTGEPAAPAGWEPECALITRPAAEVQVRRICPAHHTLLATLTRGATLEEAAGSAIDDDPDFDLGRTLLLSVEAGAIQELYS